MRSTYALPRTAFPPNAAAAPAVSPRTDRLALLVSAGLIAVVSSRLHEITAAAAYLRPALTLSLVAALVLFPRAPKNAWNRIKQNPQFRAVFGYFLWTMLVLPFAVWRGAAFDTITGAFIPIFVLFASILLLSPREHHLEFLQKAFVLSSALHIAALKFLGGGGRLTGLGSLDPNDLAALAAITTPLAIGLAQRARTGRDRLMYVGCALVLIAGVVWTSSRGGTLALLCGLASFVVLLPRQRRGTILLFVAVALPVLWFSASESYRNRIRDIVHYEDDYNVTDFWGRKAIWQRGRIYIARHPLFGVGVRGFEIYDGMYMKEIGKSGKWSAPHNAYLQATAELGIPGGAIFVLMLLSAGLTAARFALPSSKGHLSAPRPEYLSAMVAFASGAYFLSHAYSLQLFTVIALIAFAELVRRQGVTPQGRPGAVPAPPPPRGMKGWRTIRSARFGPQSELPLPGRAPSDRHA